MPVSVAEVSARVRLEVVVIKVLLAGPRGSRVVITCASADFVEGSRPQRKVLEAVLYGLRDL